MYIHVFISLRRISWNCISTTNRYPQRRAQALWFSPNVYFSGRAKIARSLSVSHSRCNIKVWWWRLRWRWVGVLTNDDRVWCFGRKIVYDVISGGFSKIYVHIHAVAYKFPFVCMASGKRALVSGLLHHTHKRPCCTQTLHDVYNIISSYRLLLFFVLSAIASISSPVFRSRTAAGFTYILYMCVIYRPYTFLRYENEKKRKRKGKKSPTSIWQGGPGGNNNNNNNMNTSPDGQICMIGKNRKERERAGHRTIDGSHGKWFLSFATAYILYHVFFLATIYALFRLILFAAMYARVCTTLLYTYMYIYVYIRVCA